jgi:HlyD family secretion protein
MADSKTTGTGARAGSPTEVKTSNGYVAGAGEGVDRKLEKKTFTPRRIAAGLGVAAFVALVAYGFASTSGGSRPNVERQKLTVSTVTAGAFQEFINVTGNVMPRITVYLDAVEGGRVEEVFAREGAVVVQGEPILSLSNSNLQLSLLNNEAAVTEQVNNLQNMRFQMEQTRLNLRQQLIQMEYEIQRLRRQHERSQELYQKQLISTDEYERVHDEYTYWQRRMELTRQSYVQDSLAQQIRLENMEESIDRMRRNFSVLQQSLENLLVRAPVAGHLTALNAEVGELRPSGFRFGQIDVLDSGYRVRANIDEFYISRVQRGQRAHTLPMGGQSHPLEVMRVYPEVRDSRFEVDLDFTATSPSSVRRGQTIRFNLELGDPAEGILLPRGGFYQTTGGNWAYVLDASGDFAVKRPIRIGRQNPEYYEVLEGLSPGDQVVTSSYETFGNADRLVFR